MTLSELYALLKSTGYPVAYSHFPAESAPQPPFITYRVEGSANFFADNRVHAKINNILVELYTEKKDLTAEAALEAVFDMNGITYETLETWIPDEGIFQKVYMIGVI
ncbi:MAG: hypothetical protein C0P72_008060 [Clostridia bacterium]